MEGKGYHCMLAIIWLVGFGSISAMQCKLGTYPDHGGARLGTCSSDVSTCKRTTISGEPPSFSCGDSDRLIPPHNLTSLRETMRLSCEHQSIGALRIEDCVCYGELCNAAKTTSAAMTLVFAATSAALLNANH